ncbi:MAG: hypothetical protein LRY71_19175 [Bacillaceae bacterium]|nr:hypothetical protein [Bacillaceae bacterium]
MEEVKKEIQEQHQDNPTPDRADNQSDEKESDSVAFTEKQLDVISAIVAKALDDFKLSLYQKETPRKSIEKEVDTSSMSTREYLAYLKHSGGRK